MQASWRSALTPRPAASTLLALLLVLGILSPAAWSQGAGGLTGGRPPEVRVKFRPAQETVGTAAVAQWNREAAQGRPDAANMLPIDEERPQERLSTARLGWHVYRLAPGERPDVVAARLSALPGVLRAEPVQRVRLLDHLPPPNDPAYTEFERGENVFPGGGIADADTWRMQWNMHYIDAVGGWKVYPDRYFSATDLPAYRPILAIIDSGIDTGHADFANAGSTNTDAAAGGQINRALSRNLIDGGANATPNDPKDEVGHGTHVAGIAAAAGNNGRYPGRNQRGFGVIGVGYNAQIAALKVIDASGNGTDQDVLDAIVFAADNGATVINMSIALDGGYSQALQDAVNYAWAKGTLIVAAAGNDGVDYVRRYPAASDKVLAVSATSGDRGIWNEQRAQYSTYGLPVSVAAPGGDLIIDVVELDLGLVTVPTPVSMFMWIWSTAPTYDTPLAGIPINNQEFRYYGYQQGTSMAAPHVAGLAALYAGYRNISAATPAGNRRIWQAIERGAHNLSGVASGGWQLQYGFGRINVANTMKELNARNTRVGTITGQLYYNTTAVPNGTLTATPVGGGRRFSAGSQQDGMYRLINLPEGDYDVRAAFFGQVQTRRVTVVAGANTPGVTFYLGDFKGDGTPPSKPSVSGAAVAGSSPVQIRARWWASDTETDVAAYEYTVGTTPGGSEVVPWTSTHHYELTITLPAGAPAGPYYLTVRAVNGEGAKSEPATSEPIAGG